MLISDSHIGKVQDVVVRDNIDLFATIDDEGALLVWEFESM